MSEEFPNFALEQKYIYLAKYQKSPLPPLIITIFNWICLLFSGSGSGYGIYWIVTLRYRQGDEIIWEILIPCLVLGLALVIGMFLKIFSDTAERVHKEGEKGKKSWFNSLLFFESSWDVLIIRLGGILGMMLFSYGVIDDFNKTKLAEAKYKASVEQELKSLSNIDSLMNKLDKYIALKDNGTGDDDDNAEAMITYLQNKIKKNEAKADSLRPVYQANIVTMGQTDNTAMLRFLAKGDEWKYGFLILLVVAIVAASIDSAAKTMTTFIAKKAQADHASKMYFDTLERQLNASTEVSTNVNSSTLTEIDNLRRIGEKFGVDFDSEKVQEIMRKINKQFLIEGRSLAAIGQDYGDSRSYISRIKRAMEEAGLLDIEVTV